MCGIVGAVAQRDVAEILINGFTPLRVSWFMTLRVLLSWIQTMNYTACAA